MTKIRANALVKDNNLEEVYGWTNNQRLLITQKLQVLDTKTNVDLYQVYNIETGQWAGVTSTDVLIIDPEVSKMQASHQDAHQIIVEGPKLHIFK